MLSAREYVEIMTIKRLSSQKGDVERYNEIKSRLDNLIYKMARIDRVSGFTPDDLEGFFCMKIWQESGKKRKYNNEFSYFAKSFQNIIRNLVRDMKTAEKRLPQDTLDNCVLFSDFDIRV